MTESSGWQERIGSRLLERPFRPHPLLPTGHLQTIVGSRIRRRFPWGWEEASRHEITLKDGCRVKVLHVAPSRAGAPTLVAVHGMTGSSESGYMQGFSHKAHLEGWGALLLNLYNTNRELRRPHPFHAGCSPSVAEILATAVGQFDLPQIFLAGVSMGGNILLKLLGEYGDSPPRALCAAAVISPLVDLSVSWQLLDRPANWIYRKYYVGRLKQLAAGAPPHVRSQLDGERLARLDTIREFDAVVTAPLSGFTDELEYYREASAFRWLSRIRVPTLAIHSRDDPLLPAEPLMGQEAAANPDLKVHLTERGGHVAFLEGKRRDIDRSWAENRVIDFFRLFMPTDSTDDRN